MKCHYLFDHWDFPDYPNVEYMKGFYSAGRVCPVGWFPYGSVTLSHLKECLSCAPHVEHRNIWACTCLCGCVYLLLIVLSYITILSLVSKPRALFCLYPEQGGWCLRTVLIPQPSAPPAAKLELWDQPHQHTAPRCSLCSWQRSGQSEPAGLALHLSINSHRFPLADIYARGVFSCRQSDQTFNPSDCWNCSRADPLIGHGGLLFSAEHNCCTREAYSSRHSYRILSF